MKKEYTELAKLLHSKSFREFKILINKLELSGFNFKLYNKNHLNLLQQAVLAGKPRHLKILTDLVPTSLIYENYDDDKSENISDYDSDSDSFYTANNDAPYHLSALHLSVIKNRPNCLRVLLAACNESDIKEANRYDSLLNLAIKENLLNIIDILLESSFCSALLEENEGDDYLPIGECIVQDNAEAFEKIYEASSFEQRKIKDDNYLEKSILLFSIEQDAFKILEYLYDTGEIDDYLIDYEYDLENEDEENSDSEEETITGSLLHLAARTNSVNCFYLLLNKHFSLYETDTAEKTAIYYILRNGNEELIRFIFELFIEKPDSNHTICIKEALSKEFYNNYAENFELLALLLSSALTNYYIYEEIIYSLSPLLHQAAKVGNFTFVQNYLNEIKKNLSSSQYEEILRILLKEHDNEGNQLIHYYCMYGSYHEVANIVNLMQHNGLSLNNTNNDERTPLMLCVEHENIDGLKFFKSYPLLPDPNHSLENANFRRNKRSFIAGNAKSFEEKLAFSGMDDFFEGLRGQEGDDPDDTNANEWSSILHLAVKASDPKVLRLFLQFPRIELKKRNKQNLKAINLAKDIAIQTGDRTKLRLLQKYYKHELNEVTTGGASSVNSDKHTVKIPRVLQSSLPVEEASSPLLSRPSQSGMFAKTEPKKFFKPAFRGVAFLTDRFNAESRYKYRVKQHTGETVFADYVHKATGIPYTDHYTPEQLRLLTQEAKNIQEIIDQLKESGKQAAFFRKEGEPPFENFYYMHQHYYSREYDGYLDSISSVLQNEKPAKPARTEKQFAIMKNLFRGFKVAANPFVSVSDFPNHAIRYAFNLKSQYIGSQQNSVYKSKIRVYDGSTKYMHFGKIFIFLIPVGQARLSNWTLHANDKITLTPSILPEAETSYPGMIPGEYLAGELIVRFPDFSQDYQTGFKDKYNMDANTYNSFRNRYQSATTPTLKEKVDNALISHLSVFYEEKFMEFAEDEAKRREGTLVYDNLKNGFSSTKPELKDVKKLNAAKKREREEMTDEISSPKQKRMRR